MLVTCNCRVLKLYTAPRRHKGRKGNYSSLRDGEGGRYGVLSVTNPNYGNEGSALDDETIVTANSSFVKMSYKEDTFIERNDVYESSPFESAINGELACSLHPSEVAHGPSPEPV